MISKSAIWVVGFFSGPLVATKPLLVFSFAFFLLFSAVFFSSVFFWASFVSVGVFVCFSVGGEWFWIFFLFCFGCIWFGSWALLPAQCQCQWVFWAVHVWVWPWVLSHFLLRGLGFFTRFGASAVFSFLFFVSEILVCFVLWFYYRVWASVFGLRLWFVDQVWFLIYFCCSSLLRLSVFDHRLWFSIKVLIFGLVFLGLFLKGFVWYRLLCFSCFRCV